MRVLVLATILLFAAAPALAQNQPQSAGRASESAVGRVGERQVNSATVANIQPMTRIKSRISNRVQSRVRNRIDRNYDPRPNATSPFEVAQEAAKRPK